MTIIVTGASGFVGRKLVDALVARYKKVRILIRKHTDLSNIECSKVEIRIGDITDERSLRGLMDVQLSLALGEGKIFTLPLFEELKIYFMKQLATMLFDS